MKDSIGYFLYNERPMSGLLNSQVINLLKEIKREKPTLLITVVSFWQPWIFIAYHKELRKMRELLSECGIKLQSYPFAIPERHFFSNPILLKFSTFTISTLFLIVLAFNKFTIIHARGYFASLIAVKVKLSIKVIFDGRSLYPLENITLGKWKREEKIYNIWEKLEKKIIEKATYSVGVSQPIVDRYMSLDPSSSVVYIPCSVNTDLLYFSEVERNRLRQKMKWGNRKVMVYLGSISISYWNDIRVYREYFRQMLYSEKDLFFLILTNSCHLEIDKELKGHVPENAYKIISSPYHELYKWLSASDFGIQVMNEMEDSFSRLGVKFTEYLACGLSVIVNEHVGAAKILVESQNLGTVLNLDDPMFKSKFKSLINNTSNDKRAMRMAYSKSQFSLSVVAQKYIQLYLHK